MITSHTGTDGSTAPRGGFEINNYAEEVTVDLDANGKITYSGKKCSDLGLKDAGEVRGQIQTTPAYRPSPTSEGARTPPPASAPAAQAPAPEPSVAAESDGPARRCFAVKTAKGNITRCNDAPPDADAAPSNP